MTDVLEALASHPACDVLRKADIDDFLARNPIVADTTAGGAEAAA